MKKILLTCLLVLSPTLVQANTASLTLSNFNYQFSGKVPTLVPDSVQVSTGISINSYALNDQHSLNTWSNSEFHMSSALDDGLNYGFASADYIPNDPSSSLQVSLGANKATSAGGSQVAFYLNYYANSTVTFTADSFATGAGNILNDYSYTYGSLLLKSYVGGEEVYSQNDDQTTSNFPELTSFKSLSVSYTGDKDAVLLIALYAQVQVTSQYIPTPVPEPETYGMMLLGLGLVGFAVKRRKLSA